MKATNTLQNNAKLNPDRAVFVGGSPCVTYTDTSKQKIHIKSELILIMYVGSAPKISFLLASLMQ